jgi:hypothetical protein
MLLILLYSAFGVEDMKLFKLCSQENSLLHKMEINFVFSDYNFIPSNILMNYHLSLARIQPIFEMSLKSISNTQNIINHKLIDNNI